MEPDQPTPTRSETTLAQRQVIIRLHQEGASYPSIAVRLGCSVWTVGRWVRAWQRGGPAALAAKSRRPGTPHPQTTPVAVQERIRALRQAHPGWGARLLHRQLAQEAVVPLPSEVTIQAWLRRQGFPLVRPPTAKPLGWETPLADPTRPLWQADFKQKRGSRT